MSARFRQSREEYEVLLQVRRDCGAKSLKAMLNGFLVDAIARALESQEETEDQNP